MDTVLERVFLISGATGEVDTEIDVQPGDELLFHAWGEISPGPVEVAVTSTPDGWADVDGRETGDPLPMPDAPRYALLCKLGEHYRYVGSEWNLYYRGPESLEAARLILTVNDKQRGASGSYSCHVEVRR